MHCILSVTNPIMLGSITNVDSYTSKGTLLSITGCHSTNHPASLKLAMSASLIQLIAYLVFTLFRASLLA